MIGVRHAVARFCMLQRSLAVALWVLGASRALPGRVAQLRCLFRVRLAAAGFRRELLPRPLQCKRKLGRIVATLPAVLAALFAVPIVDASATTTGLRNQRYCEVIPSVTQESTVTTYIYNTQGLNLCPADQWDALTEGEVNQEYGAQSAQLNGPRHWMMDTLDATGSSTTGRTFTFGGIEMSLRGTIVTSVGTPTVGEQFYVPNTVQRQTVYTFKGGQPIYELIDLDKNVYVMQSYAQIVDKNLSINQLPALGHVLSLPAGWRYRERTPRHSVQLIATGIAHVINDNLADSYQRMTKPSVQLSGLPSGCVRGAFKVRAQVGGDTANTRVSVGFRTVKRTTSNDFTVNVPVSHRPGSRRLSVMASNDAGTARARASFRVCTPAPRRLTGLG
jgi:hypothetical protein